MRLRHPLRSFIFRFCKSTSGGVLILFGLSVVMLVGISGAGVDLAVQQLMRVKLQGASDAAALSAASLRTMSGTPSAQQRETAALRYFNLNYPPEFYGVQRPVPAITVAAEDVTVNAGAGVETSFVRHLGISTLDANSHAVAAFSQLSVSDFDVLIVVDESGSEGSCTVTPPTGSPCPPGMNRMGQMKTALTAMINTLQPTGQTVNPNVRIGIVGYSRAITNKWGLSANNADSLAALAALRPLGQNFDHVGMLAAASYMQGGTPGTPNGPLVNLQNTGTPNVFDASTTAAAMPVPRTPRAPAAGEESASVMSPLKYVIFITDGGIMLEPSSELVRTQNITTWDAAGNPVVTPQTQNPNPQYDQTVQSFCPNSNAYSINLPPGTNTGPCYPAFNAACNAVKNAVGPDSVHLYVANFVEPPNSQATASMRACASTNLITGQPDYKFAPTPEEFASWIQSVTSQIQAVRLQQ